MQLINYNVEAKISFESRSMEKIIMLCESALESITEDEAAKFKLKSVIHELVTNCVEHGYKKSQGKIIIALKRYPDAVFFEICDEGAGFDHSQIDLDRRVDSLDSVTARGWGLMIINKFAKDLTISRNTPRGTRISLKIPVIS